MCPRSERHAVSLALTLSSLYGGKERADLPFSPHFMPVEIELGGRPNLPKLAKAGRIKLNPDGSVVGALKNNVLSVIKKPIKHESGVVIGQIKIEENGGHIHEEGSVWRVGLFGPTIYHKKVLADEQRKERTGTVGFRPAAPELEQVEFEEYKEYKEFLKEKGVAISTDEEFYAQRKGKPGRPRKEV